MSNQIPKTSIQIAFEKSEFARGDVDLSRYATTGEYIFASGKDAFEMYMHYETREQLETLKKMSWALLSIDLNKLKKINTKCGGIYIDEFKSTKLSANKNPVTKCAIEVRDELDNEYFSIEVSEYLQHELYCWITNELKKHGIKVFLLHADWLKESEKHLESA